MNCIVNVFNVSETCAIKPITLDCDCEWGRGHCASAVLASHKATKCFAVNNKSTTHAIPCPSAGEIEQAISAHETRATKFRCAMALAFIINLLFDEEKIFLFLSFLLRLPVLNFTKITYNPAAASHHTIKVYHRLDSLTHSSIYFIVAKTATNRHRTWKRTQNEDEKKKSNFLSQKIKAKRTNVVQSTQDRTKNKSVVCGATGRLVDGVYQIGYRLLSLRSFITPECQLMPLDSRKSSQSGLVIGSCFAIGTRELSDPNKSSRNYRQKESAVGNRIIIKKELMRTRDGQCALSRNHNSFDVSVL